MLFVFFFCFVFRIQANGNRHVLLSPANQIAGKSLIVQGLPTDKIEIDASTSQGEVTMCDISSSIVENNTVQIDGTNLTMIAPLDITIDILAMPVGVITADNFGQVELHMTDHKDIVTIFKTGDVTSMTIRGRNGDDEITAHAMGAESDLEIYGDGGKDELYCKPSPLDLVGELDQVCLQSFTIMSRGTGILALNSIKNVPPAACAL